MKRSVTKALHEEGSEESLACWEICRSLGSTARSPQRMVPAKACGGCTCSRERVGRCFVAECLEWNKTMFANVIVDGRTR